MKRFMIGMFRTISIFAIAIIVHEALTVDVEIIPLACVTFFSTWAFILESD